MSTKDRHEAIARALSHHETAGAIRTVSPPYPGRPKWIVTLGAGAPEPRLELTNAEAWALCEGLAAAERAAKIKSDSYLHVLYGSLASIPAVRDALVKLDPDYIYGRFNDDVCLKLHVDCVKLAVGEALTIDTRPDPIDVSQYNDENLERLFREFLSDNDDAGEIFPGEGQQRWIADALYWLTQRKPDTEPTELERAASTLTAEARHAAGLLADIDWVEADVASDLTTAADRVTEALTAQRTAAAQA